MSKVQILACTVLFSVTGQMILTAGPIAESSSSSLPRGLTHLICPGIKRTGDPNFTCPGGTGDAAIALFMRHAGVRRGIHGTYTPLSNKPYWFDLDLGKMQPIDGVALVPTGANGYGFPVRFRIEISNDSEFRTADTLADETAHDFPNPGPYPYFAKGAGKPARYVRVFAKKRWPQHERMWMGGARRDGGAIARSERGAGRHSHPNGPQSDTTPASVDE